MLPLEWHEDVHLFLYWQIAGDDSQIRVGKHFYNIKTRTSAYLVHYRAKLFPALERMFLCLTVLMLFTNSRTFSR